MASLSDMMSIYRGLRTPVCRDIYSKYNYRRLSMVAEIALVVLCLLFGKILGCLIELRNCFEKKWMEK